MNRINLACQRKRWLRILVVATLVSLNLAPAQAQDFTQQLAGFSWVLCRRHGPPQIEPQAGQWKTWVITSGSQFRLPRPPHGLAQVAEVRNLIARADQRDAAALSAISFWDAGPPGYRWNEIAANLLVRNNITGPRSARVLSLLNVAIYDATIAAWDSKYVYKRPRPSEVSSRVDPAIPVPNSPSYPSEHAATAGAAAAALGYLFPHDAAYFTSQAQEAGLSRLHAGIHFRSDIEAGLEIGRAVRRELFQRRRVAVVPGDEQLGNFPG
jgi:hypothetical protein